MMPGVMTVVWVGLGGCLGSIARYLLSGFVQSRTGAAFPFGTLAVNVAGCFAMGAVSELAESYAFLSPQARAFLAVGILGGFTTFSAFGNETLNLARDGERGLAFGNVAAHLVFALGAVWLGRMTVHGLWK
jgi:CrcB protein